MAPQRPIGFWLKLLDRLIDEQFDSILEEHGVTRRQWQVLSLLSNGDATSTQLAEALDPFVSGEEPETLAEELDELVSSGWVERHPDDLRLTDRGRASFVRLGAVVQRTREQLARDVTEEEYTATLDLLQRMARNLGWRDPVTDG